ncbi:hypothetical protein [Frondihabitans australicus]|uniref:DUF559 domain-containing protein n=1 Tax=Frondihabitans australicus TaxID=386892 RepID=A0A495IEC8_9MICO|nr:hypothetical protein [Frondihabitans australicus]RKR74353.1 hypothetical protein C8E83_1464 [Frondihabitans australicus]
MRPRPLPPLLDGAPFRVADAVPSVGRERLRRADLEAPGVGLRAPVGTGLTPQSLWPALAPAQRFSHATAAALLKLPLPWRLRSGLIHVTTTGTGAVMRRRGVAGHRSVSPASIEVDGLRVSESADVFVECAGILSLDQLVALGDAVAGPESGGGRDLLVAAVARHAGGRHAVRLREALALVRENVESAKETELRLLIIRDGLPEPSCNRPVYDSRGVKIGRPDLGYPSVRLGIEYEGDHHRTDRDQWRRDIRRRERFAAAGWRTLRVTDDDLGPHSREFLGRLRSALRLDRM